MRKERLPFAIGALTALVVVVVIVAAIVVGGGGPSRRSKELPTDARVMVVVVVPDLHGVATPVAITLYPAFPSAAESEAVDPETPVTVSGTSANTLRAAYPFGGGATLSAGIAQARGIAEPYWVVIDQAGLQQLASGTTIRIHLDHPVDVFDGTRLSSFPSGTVEATPLQVAPLMAGVARLNSAEAASVRGELGAEVLRLAVANPADVSAVTTSLTPMQLSAWLERMRAYSLAGR